MADDGKDDLIRGAVRQLLRVAHKCARIEELPIPVEGAGAVTTREAHTIQAIGEREGMSVTDLATTFGITKSAASQMVAKLAAKGFLAKTRAPHSNKEWQLGLTPLGWRAFLAHERAHGRDFARVVDHLDGLSLSQIATLTVLLEAIGSIMDDRLDEANRQATPDTDAPDRTRSPG